MTMRVKVSWDSKAILFTHIIAVAILFEIHSISENFDK